MAYRLAENTGVRAGGGTFYVPSTARFPDGPTGNPVNQRTNNMAPSVDNNVTFVANLSNPFPTGVENYPGRDPSFQRVLLGGTGNQYYRDEKGYPGHSQQFNVALQHQFAKSLSVEAAYIGLRGSDLPATLNQNQLGLDYIDRAANDTTVCSLTGNVIIPQGQPGYTSTQRDTCYGAYLRQQVPNPFQGVIREGALSTAMVQRNLLLVPFPEYSSANRPGYFGKSSYNALQLRADKRFGAGSVISANYTFSRNYGNVETVTGWLESGAGNAAAGYQTNNLENEFALEQLRRPAQVRRQLHLGLAVRRRPPVRRRGNRYHQHAHQRVERERLHHAPGRIAARIYCHAQFDRGGLWIAPECRSELRQEGVRLGSRSPGQMVQHRLLQCAQCGVRRR